MDKGLREVDDFINHVPKSNTLRKSKEEIYEKVNQNNLLRLQQLKPQSRTQQWNPLNAFNFR